MSPSVDKMWMKQRVSQPQNHSPCPRVSVYSVLTDRRPAPPPSTHPDEIEEAGSCETHSFLTSFVSPEGRFCVFRGKKKSPSQVDSTWMKQRASQSQNHSPCPCASVHSVLTDRRPVVRHAPRAARVLRAPDHLPTDLCTSRICDGNMARLREAHPSPASSVSPEGRFCVFCGKRHPSPVDQVWMKSRASQPQIHSPCPRVSVHSVLTGRRPTVRHAPRAARVHCAPDHLRVIEPQMPQIRFRRHGSTQMELAG